MGSVHVTKILKEHGYTEDRTTGSHLIMRHPESRKIAVVPLGRKDLPLGTIKSIFKQAKIDMER